MPGRDVTTRLCAVVVSARPSSRAGTQLRALLVAIATLLAGALLAGAEPMLASQTTVAAFATMTLLAVAVTWAGARARLVPVRSEPTRVGVRHRYDLTPPWRCPDIPRSPQRPRAPGLD